MNKPALFLGVHKKPGTFSFRFVLLCFVMLLGSPARGQSETEDKLAPRDTVEIRVWNWEALGSGAAEAFALNDVFTIGSDGLLDLPTIGYIPAAGLHTSDLAQLITDRLHARSGERAITTIQRNQTAVALDSVSVEGPPAVVQPSANSSRTPIEPAVTTQQQALERERSKAGALQRDLSAAQMEVEAARGEAIAARQGLAGQRQLVATLTQELSAAQGVIATLKAQAAQQANVASRAKQAAEVLANEQRELAKRERGKAAALEQELHAARREIDALKGGAQKTAADREEARRDMVAVQRELDAMRRVARDGSAQARAAADKQKQALEGQRQIADGLARELAAVQREFEGLKAKAIPASPAKAGDVKALLAAEASLADARRVIDQERQKAGMLERDLAAARQSLAALEATADHAAAAQASAMRDLQAVEATTKRLSEALLLQRQRADEATGEVRTARQERDAAKQEAIRVATAQREAFEDEQGKAISLARELAAARKEVDSLKSRGQRGIARVENGPKARATTRASASIRSKPKSGSKSELREVRKTEVRRSSRSVALPPSLPVALFPTRPPM